MSSHNEEQQIGRMSAEALRRHLEELTGVNVSLSSGEAEGLGAGEDPVAGFGAAEFGHADTDEVDGEEALAGMEQPARAQALTWTSFQMSGTVRGRIYIGASTAVIKQMLQLAMSEPVDTGVASSEGAALDMQTRDAWRDLLADALQRLAGELRGSLGWDDLLAICDAAGAEEDMAEPGVSESGAMQRLRIESGDLRLPLVVRTRLDVEGSGTTAERTSGVLEAHAGVAKAGIPESSHGDPDGNHRPASVGNTAGPGFAGVESQGGADAASRPDARTDVRAADRGSGQGSGYGNAHAESRGMELLMDVELEATLRFGSRELSLHEVLSLGPGGVIELDRHVNEPVDLVVADKIVARGEVVMIHGNFGLRVTEVATPQLRLESIRCLF